MRTRTENVSKNLTNSIIFQVTNIVIKFVLRTIFIYTLGKEYLGVNGVFNNILSVLSLSELGLSTVIVFDMYKPIAEDNKKLVVQYFDFFRFIYSIIGLFIIMIGISLLPFLDKLVKDVPNVKHIRVYYLLQLGTTAASYFFAQYRSFIDAHQLNAINTANNWLFAIIRTVLQSIVLIVWKNYMLYLLVELIVVIVSNYVLSIKCKQRFPYISNKVERLPATNKRTILRNAMSTFSIKVGITVVNATDNLLISTLISTIVVGIYSNYGLITTIITASTMLISSSIQASVGNLCVEGDARKSYNVYKRIRFLYCSIYSFVCVCLFTLINMFIEIWAGHEYLLSEQVVLIIVINLYLTGVHQPIEVYMYADGLFRYFKIKPWVEILINLGISILLGKCLGISGIFLGTLISHVTTTLWYDSKVVYNHTFKLTLKVFWADYLRYFIPTVLIGIVACWLVGVIHLGGTDIVGLLLKTVIVALIFLSLWVLYYRNSEELCYYIGLFKALTTKHTESKDARP